ncbi:MAG: UDP-N-acetylmuramyl pentapeptide phosphotransferase/UDP-N-acetylglucosamine-phosphate transferase [Planctomycetota bacterium]|nr:UDP-N-acetylmuramyl pentapeptide phosphotransferase/UDP-N-acetylglucosamine-phosphate transferase [Planctomycetota bacterium]
MTLAAVGIVGYAMVLSAILCAIARRVAPRIGLIDKPDARKAHEAPTPLGGGVAIWMTTALVLSTGVLALKFGHSWLPPDLAIHAQGALDRIGELGVIVGLSTAIMVLGLLDDRFKLGWQPRILVQFAVAIAFVLTGDRVTLFQAGGSATRFLMAALTVFWIVGLTNAFNFLDNMDGLAASVGLIAALLFVGAQVAVGSLFVPAVLLVLVGALAGFLLHNRPPARLFMGDAGSNFLGFLLGTLTVAGTFTRAGFPPYGIVTPLLVMAVPLYDTASVVLIRLREGRSPFQPDRCHLSHRLVDRGLTPARAVATIGLITLAGGLGSLLLSQVNTAFGAAVIVAQTICLLGLVAVLEVSTGKA